LPRFREYLKAIHFRRAADHRNADAETHMGNLDKLDRVPRQYAVDLEKPH
jgi:hypothetical protein